MTETTDRLVRKEVALGTIREIEPPLNHIGLQLFPWMPVASDDVIFDYAKPMTDGLAPARAEDADAATSFDRGLERIDPAARGAGLAFRAFAQIERRHTRIKRGVKI